MSGPDSWCSIQGELLPGLTQPTHSLLWLQEVPSLKKQPCVLRSHPQEDSHRTLSPALAFGAGLQELGAELLRLSWTLRHPWPWEQADSDSEGLGLVMLMFWSGKSGGEIKLGKK